MIPTFLSRRLRWVSLAGLASALWINRRDVARWLRFGRRSIRRGESLDLSAWMTEARVRAAVSLDPVLRADPSLDDIEVDDGNVTIRTRTTTWPDLATHMSGLRKVKGVADVRFEPGRLVGGTRLAADGTPVI